MDVLRLNESTLIPDELIKGHTSMIWTERFLEPGDFELKTALVEETMELLPEDSLISLRDTREVMLVDTHSISRDAEGRDVLTVTGKTVENFLNNRPTYIYIIGSGFETQPWVLTGNMTAADIATFLVDNSISSNDPGLPVDVRNNYISILNAGVDLATTLPFTSFFNETGELYPKIIDLIGEAGVGVRNIRPPGPNNEAFITIQFYNGLDRSGGAVVNGNEIPEIALDVEEGHITNASYLFSNRDYKNVAWVWSPIGRRIVYGPGVSASVTGLDRRVLFVNASDITTAGSSTVAAVLTQRGLSELKKHTKTEVFDCEVSPDIPYKYKVDYDLGDSIRVKADYGVDKKMLVSEYIRIDDADGDRGYPTLSSVD